MNISFRKIAALAPIVLCGCALEPVAAESAPETDDGAVATAQEAVAAGAQFAWTQGNPATPMGDTSNGTCFLTMMRGQFDDYSESVRISPNSGSWLLTGASQTAGVAARARCAIGSYTGEFSWTQGTDIYPVLLAPTSTHTCFLTRVTGEFRNSAAFVHVYKSGGNWYLFGDSNHSGVGARARCIEKRPQPQDSPYSWWQGDAPLQLAPTASGTLCALTYVAGNFRSSAERVEILNGGDYWYLSGASDHNGVNARAVCF